MVKPYIVTTTEIKIRTWASDEQAAIQNVMAFENCPRTAILSIKESKQK